MACATRRTHSRAAPRSCSTSRATRDARDPPRPSLAVPESAARGLGELARTRSSTRCASPTLDRRHRHQRQDHRARICTAQALGAPQRPCAYIGTLGYWLPPALARHDAHDARLPHAAPRDRGAAARRASRWKCRSHALAQDRIAGPRLPHRGVHQSHARPSRRARRLRELRPRQSARCSQLPGLAARGAERRRPVRRHASPRCSRRAARRCRAARAARRPELERDDRGAPISPGSIVELSGRFGSDALASRGSSASSTPRTCSRALGALLAHGHDRCRTRAPRSGAAHAAAGPHGSARRRAPGRPCGLIDYAHTPDALAARADHARRASPRRSSGACSAAAATATAASARSWAASPRDLADRHRAHRRQSAQRGSGGDRPRHPRGHGAHTRASAVIHDRRAAIATAIRARAAAATSCSWPARVTSRSKSWAPSAGRSDDRAVALELLGRRQ